MKCLECRGACCEMIGLHVSASGGLSHTTEWLRARGIVKEFDAKLDPVFVVLESRCPKLDSKGLCGIYEDRPAVCVDFAPGSHDCLMAVRLRRTPGEYQRIRDKEDPEVNR